MLEEIRKGLLSAFGAVLLTKERTEEVTQRLVKEAKISKEDAQALAEELFETGTRQWSEMEESLSKAFSKGIENLRMMSLPVRCVAGHRIGFHAQSFLLRGDVTPQNAAPRHDRYMRDCALLAPP
jgi:polyhydroxyalkanoate synthesis regulator phasin